MNTRITRASGSLVGWLLVGLTVLPLLATSAESNEAPQAHERLERLVAKHDVRVVIYSASAPAADCAAHDPKEGAR